MSVEAITWALSQKVERSTAKFVLVAMANCANNDLTCWPSVDYLSAATCQDRKTVLENIKRLKADGFIADTTLRKGRTGQVIVYQLKNPDNGTVDSGSEQAQKRNSSENGTVPKTDDKSPENGGKQSRFSVETVPKTGHGTVKNRNETKKNRQGARGTRLPDDWILKAKHAKAATEIEPAWSADEIRLIGDMFRDHWKAAPGQGGIKCDWDATWRNWCRKQKMFGSAKSGARGGWWGDDDKAIAKGAEIGIKPLPGEHMYTFKLRIQAAIDNGGKPPAPAAAPASTTPPALPLRDAPADVSPENRAAALAAARALKPKESA